MRKVDNKYKCIPFWSWNAELDEKGLVDQINWMYEKGIGGYFMHARGGLTTEYLGNKWFSCVQACEKRGKELGMQAYAYDENGWPSGFAGGKLLEDIENHDRCLTYTLGAYDPRSLVSYDMSGDSLIRVKEGDNCLNVFMQYSPSTADILNPEVMDKFIELTHEQYKKTDLYQLKGFFTDEPQYYRWGHPFTKVLFDYWKETYNEDILDGLGLMFVEKEGYKKFRYRYWVSMQQLMLKNWAEKIYNWCDKNGYKLTGHYVEETSMGNQIMCCGGVMPFYEYEHIPGMDYLGRWNTTALAPKQLGSACAQLDKKQVISEMFACCGWDVNPIELKRIAEQQYVDGVNLMCQHLLPYKENGQKKRDYPSHFSAINPWIEKNFLEFNDYFSVLGELLSNSKENINIGVIHPIRSCYFDYKRMAEHFNVKEQDTQLLEFVNFMSKKHIPYHFIDETIYEKHGRVQGKQVLCGEWKYDVIILPNIITLSKYTESMLKQYVANGGKVYIYGKKPTYREWEEFNYSYLKSNTTLEEIVDSLDFECEDNENIRLTYRTDKEGRPYIYCANIGDATSMRVKAKGYKSFESYNILKDEYEVIDGNLDFEESQSYILYFSNKEVKDKQKLKELRLCAPFEIVKEVENNLTLDYARYSLDGVSYSDSIHHMGIFNELLEKRYSGVVYLKYEFQVKDVPSICTALVEDERILSLEVNGNKVTENGLVQDFELLEFNIAKYIKEGNNEIVISKKYYQDQVVYDVLFGNGTESLKNCLAYTSNIEAIYLKGNFGINGEFKQGRRDNILLGKNFVMVKQPKQINEIIKGGFPMLYGDITLRKEIEVDDVNQSLVFDGRFQLLEVSVNGSEKQMMMFSKKMDLSKLLKKGKNTIELTLTVGKRNQMGPFHTPDQEDYGVGPYTFERFGTWKNGKSSIMRDSYSFLKTII